MVDISPLVRSDAQIIQAYAGGVFKVSGQNYEGAVIVAVDAVAQWSEIMDAASDALTLEMFAPLLDQADQIDVVLLGTGEKLHLLPAPLRAALKQAGLTVEVMNTGAACRTYNVLMAEGRRVVAALLPV